MKNNQLNKAVFYPTASLELLNQCSQKLFSKLERQDYYENLLTCCFCILPATKFCLLFLSDADKQQLKLAKSKGIELGKIRKKNIPVEDGVTGNVAASGNRKIVYDVTGMNDAVELEVIQKENIGALIALPLKISGEVLAVLNIYLTKPVKISPENEIILDIFAGNASLAFQNVYLFQNRRHTLNDIQTILHVARNISTMLDIDQVLDNIINAARKISDTDIISIWYKDFQTNCWERKVPPHLKALPIKLPNIEVGQGIIGQVLKTGHHHLCGDTSKVDYYFPTWADSKSELAIPLKLDNVVKGILNIESSRFNAFTERHFQLLSILAEDAAIALRNAQLWTIAERKTKQFITLKEIGEALSQRKSLKEILQLIASEALQIVGHGNKVVWVLLLDKKKQLLETKASCGDLAKKKDFSFHVSLQERSVVNWVVKHRQIKIIPDVEKEENYLKVNPQTKSEICIPLIFRDEVIGAINIESSELNAFGDRDQELLQTLADNAAIATQIGELYDIRLRQLEALYKIGTEITSSLDLREVLNTIAEEALSAIGRRRRTLYLQLLDDEKRILQVKAATGLHAQTKYLDRQFPFGLGISGWVVQHKKSYLCTNVKKDPYYYEINPLIHSELCVPIHFKDKVIGLINVESMLKNDFGHVELQLLDNLAQQAGIAITNAHLNQYFLQSQQELAQASEMVSAGEMLAGISHDIRNMCAVIASEATWIIDKIDKNNLSTEETKKSMQNIISHIRGIKQMTEDLSRRTRQFPIDFRVVNLVSVLKETVYLMTSLASRHAVNINIAYQQLDFPVEVDVKRLKSAIINIIKNAIDAMPDGGDLTISGRKSEVDFELHFADTGIGIPKETINKVLNRFFTTKEVGRGMGMGLAIVKRFVEEEHHGKILIKSEEYKGTEVIIRLPLRQIKNR